MKKAAKIVLIIFLGGLIVSFGNTIGGLVGNFLTIIGGVGLVFGVVKEIKKQPAKPGESAKQ